MTDYNLTRRDALAALATAGVAVTGASHLTWESLEEDPPKQGAGLTPERRDRLDAVAEIVYPGAVSGIRGFVETYVVGRVREDPERLQGMVDALDYLDAYARDWQDSPFLDLDRETQEVLMESMGADVVDPDPDGSEVFRFRFYVVNELLYALYSSPTGGELLGLENPQGYPGGTDSYQQPPD